MKIKQIYIILLLVILGVMGCTKESENDTVKLAVSLPQEVGQQRTAPVGDALKANKLYCYVYLKNTTTLVHETYSTFGSGSLSTTLPAFNLPKGYDYDVILYACYEVGSTCSYTYTKEGTNAGLITRKSIGEYEIRSDVEQDDLFYKKITLNATDSKTISTTLNRATAQLNVSIANSDWNACTTYYTPTYIKVKVTNAYTTLNMRTGAYGGATVQNYTTKISDLNSTSPSGSSYKWVSSNYFFTNGSNATVDIYVYKDTTTPTASSSVVTSASLSNVPLTTNYRTNISGSMLMSKQTLSVTKNKNWGGTDKDKEITDGPVFSTSFETASEFNDWICNKKSNKYNLFIRGTGAGATTGTYALYVSKDSNTYKYDTDNAATYAAHLLELQAGSYTISYKCICYGESIFDYGWVFITRDTPSTFDSKLSDELQTWYNSWTATPIYYSSDRLNFTTITYDGSWQSISSTFTIPTTGTYYIVIGWYADDSVVNNPPLAIDDLEIVKN